MSSRKQELDSEEAEVEVRLGSEVISGICSEVSKDNSSRDKEEIKELLLKTSSMSMSACFLVVVDQGKQT
jgi:hypothetical protein